MATEQSVLAGARSQAASESASRSALYLGSSSSALIALGLTSQLSKGTALFQVFALVALRTVFVLGVFTFARPVDIGIEDFLLGRAINRIRHHYLERASDTARYFMLSGNDDADGVMASIGIEPGQRTQCITAAEAAAVVNSVVAVALAVGLRSEGR